MTRYDVILLVFVIFFLAFAGYFIYRESTDPILFPGGEQVQTLDPGTKQDAASRRTIQQDDSDATFPQKKPEPEQALAPSQNVSSVNPEELETRVDETLRQQVGQLAALMENRLASSFASTQEQITGQSEKLKFADQVMREALGTYQENTRLSVEGLSETLNLISEMWNESESVTTELENARTSWNQLFDDVTTIDEQSEDRLAEAHFDFKTYRVAGAETLSEIARRLEVEYDIPESDLSFLLNHFNDIEFQLYDPGGRRPPTRVVANDSLRVPVPKTTGTILQDYALPDKLHSQINHINEATSANTRLRKNLTRQVDKLKELEANVQAIASMSETLRQIDLSTESPFPDNTDLTPAQQEAWQEFENALADYRSASGFEEEQMARGNLQRSISRILEQYEQDYLEAADTAADPLDYYLRFIEKYRPGNTAVNQKR